MQMGSYPQPIPVNQKKHTGFGWASLILSIVTLVIIILVFVLIFANIGYVYVMLVSIFGLVGFILSILAIIFGALAFFGRHKDKIGLIGFIMGIVLIILSLIAPSLGAYLYVSDGIDRIEPINFLPSVSISIIDHSDDVNGFGDNLFVLTHTGGERILWEDLSIRIHNEFFDDITDETNVINLSGSFSVGQSVIISEKNFDNPITSSEILDVQIIHLPTNSLIFDSSVFIE